MRHSPADAEELLAMAASHAPKAEERTLVECRLDDGQRLVALNELFIGHASHQTARYRLEVGGETERQMSSGMIVATGTGATGWANSICRGMAGKGPTLPEPGERTLVFLVREAYAGPVSGVTLTAGVPAGEESLKVTSEMDAGGAVFGDGIEADRVEFGYGMRAEVRVAGERLRLLAG